MECCESSDWYGDSVGGKLPPNNDILISVDVKRRRALSRRRPTGSAGEESRR